VLSVLLGRRGTRNPAADTVNAPARPQLAHPLDRRLRFFPCPGGAALESTRQIGRYLANGVRLGRKPTLTYHRQREAIKCRAAGKETLGKIARSYNVSR
jgi:hypothetical protein